MSADMFAMVTYLDIFDAIHIINSKGHTVGIHHSLCTYNTYGDIQS